MVTLTLAEAGLEAAAAEVETNAAVLDAETVGDDAAAEVTDDADKDDEDDDDKDKSAGGDDFVACSICGDDDKTNVALSARAFALAAADCGAEAFISEPAALTWLRSR